MSQSPPPPPPAAPAYAPSLPSNRGGAALALGICSIAFGGACGIGLILGIIGFKIAQTDLDEIARGLKDRNGEGLLQAGKICSIIGMCFGTLGLLFGLFYAVVMILAVIGAAAGA